MTVSNTSPTSGQRQKAVFHSGQSVRKISNSDKPKVSDESFRRSIQAEAEHQEFTILKTLSVGEFSRIYLARPELGACKRSLEQALVLKAFKTETTTEDEFFSELELNYFLSPHPNIVTSFQVSFVWDEFRIFPQEHARYGDLSRFIRKECPMPEGHVKSVATQLSAALDFMHSLKLVHMDVVPENVLVFQKDCSLVKLSDFGATVAARTLLTKTIGNASGGDDGGGGEAEPTTVTTNSNPNVKSGNRSRSNSVTGAANVVPVKYLPPEICGILPQEKYHCYSSIDVWQLGILIFACITGGGCPWKMADCIRDVGFNHYCDWLKRRGCMKTPLAFQAFSSRFTRLLKRMLEPKPTKRCHAQEVTKYLKDEWLVGDGTNKSSFLAASLVSRSNSENVAVKAKDPLNRSATCKKSNSLSVRRKSVVRAKMGTGLGTACEELQQRKDPVFRICCQFQSKNQSQAAA